MKKVGVRAQGAEAQGGGVACNYSIGDKVEHPRFGQGEIKAIERLATDNKLVVDFGEAGEKTLLAQFAKLTKL